MSIDDRCILGNQLDRNDGVRTRAIKRRYADMSIFRITPWNQFYVRDEGDYRDVEEDGDEPVAARSIQG